MAFVGGISASAWAGIASAAVAAVGVGMQAYESSRASAARSRQAEEQRKAAQQQQARAAAENAHKRRAMIAQRKRQQGAIINAAAGAGAVGSSGALGGQYSVTGKAGSNAALFESGIAANQNTRAAMSNASFFGAQASKNASMGSIYGGIGNTFSSAFNTLGSQWAGGNQTGSTNEFYSLVNPLT